AGRHAPGRRARRYRGPARRAGGTAVAVHILTSVLLAIDLGNTQTHIGMFRGEELVENWRLATVRETTGDELATLLVNLLELRDLRLRDVDDVILSSVVPSLTPEYERLAERYLSGTFTVVGPGMKTG